MKVQQKDNKANNKFKAGAGKNRASNENGSMSAGKIKKRIRDTQRTISRKDMAADAITEAKRRLRVLQFDLGEKIIDEHERANATKYHMVKHFERNKINRKLKQAKKEVQNATEKDDAEKVAKYAEKVEEWEIKALYNAHYPKTLAYISLFPKENADDVKSSSRRTKLLEEIKQAVAAGDKDLTLLKKRYRDSYKESMIKRKIIQPVAPVDIEEMEVDKKAQDNDNSSSDSDDNQDDFFEKA